MGNSGALLGASRINAPEHLRIDGRLLMREEELQEARRSDRFGFRKPFHQFMKLLFRVHSVSPTFTVYLGTR